MPVPPKRSTATGGRAQLSVECRSADAEWSVPFIARRDVVPTPGGGVAYDLPDKQGRYLLAEGRRLDEVPRAAAFRVQEGTCYELIARVTRSDPGAARLWLAQYDDTRRLEHVTKARLRNGITRVLVTAAPGARVAAVAVRLAGRGHIEALSLRLVERPAPVDDDTSILDPTEVAALRRSLAATSPLRAYENLSTTESAPIDQARELRSFRAGRWRSPTFPTTRLEPPVKWARVATAHRSWTFRRDAFEWARPALLALGETPDGALLDQLVSIVDDWLAGHGQQAPGQEGSFVWYDMAVGLRAVRLAYLVDAICHVGGRDAALVHLVRALRAHVVHLADPANFAGQNNHGVFQAAGLAAAARRLEGVDGRLGLRQWSSFARALLTESLLAQFGTDGGHLEHSPEYHGALTVLLLRCIRTGLVDDERLTILALDAQAVLAWLVRPDGRIVTIGDSAGQAVADDECFEAPTLRWALTAGREGSPPSGRIIGLGETGYVAARAAPEGSEERSSHLVQICGAHSEAHRHDDALSFVWSEAGRDLVVDPGRFGYVYDDPRRQYVVARRAHSTVEFTPTADTGRPAVALCGVGDVSAAVWATTQSERGARWHRRTLVLRPGEWLLVLDEIDGGATGLQRFHLGPELSARAVVDGAVAVDGDGLELHACALSGVAPAGVQAGVAEPGRQLGWIARRDRDWSPTAVVTFASHAGSVALVTLLSVGDRPEGGGCRLAEDTRVAEWTTADTAWSVTLGPGAPVVASAGAQPA